MAHSSQAQVPGVVRKAPGSHASTPEKLPLVCSSPALRAGISVSCYPPSFSGALISLGVVLWAELWTSRPNPYV